MLRHKSARSAWLVSFPLGTFHLYLRQRSVTLLFLKDSVLQLAPKRWYDAWDFWRRTCHRKLSEWWGGCKGFRLCCVSRKTFSLFSTTCQKLLKEMKLPVGVKMQAREPREGLTRSSSLGFCQGTGRDQNNCALVGNSTHPSITCSLQWRPTKRLAQS